MHPYDLLPFLQEKMKAWSTSDRVHAEYLASWAIHACIALNRTSCRGISQAALSMLDMDAQSDNFEEWTALRLNHTLGPRKSPSSLPHGPGSVLTNAIPQIINVHPTITPPTIDQMDLAFARGAEAHKEPLKPPSQLAQSTRTAS